MISDPAWDKVLRKALAEDIGSGDITSEAVIPAETRCRAEVIAKQDLVVAGLPQTARAFALLDPEAEVRILCAEGNRAKRFEALAEVVGNARALLAAERTFLNILQRLCGIATLTARFVAAVEGTTAHIADTRKTTPGLRMMEKYAVRMGGGVNHRQGLYDHILIKDNHIKIAGGVAPALAAARSRAGFLYKIEVEVTDLAECEQALAAGADIIMLDNFTASDIIAAVDLIGGRALVEVSGGVTLERVKEIALAGADIISVGALTHSAPAADISLEILGVIGYI
jgi:nicotinate-nucleotide pyrophosphorylase (carboxylating)